MMSQQADAYEQKLLHDMVLHAAARRDDVLLSRAYRSVARENEEREHWEREVNCLIVAFRAHSRARIRSPALS